MLTTFLFYVIIYQKREKIMKDKKNRLQRQIELLQKYYDIDTENRCITTHLNIDKITDLFQNEVNMENRNPLFKREIIDKMIQLSNQSPTDFKMNFIFEVNDFQDYDEDEMLGYLKDNIEILQFQSFVDKRKKFKKGIILLSIGILFLAFNIFGQFFHWFGKDTSFIYLILTEMIDISAWVFVWEAVAVMLLERGEETAKLNHFTQKIGTVSFIKKNTSD